MKTISIEVPITPDKKTVEFTLPCYRQEDNGRVFYKIVSEKQTIIVDTYDFSFGIEVRDRVVKSAIEPNTKECTAQEFEGAYDITNARIISALMQK